MFLHIKDLFGGAQVIWNGESYNEENEEKIIDSEGQTFLDFNTTPSLFA